MAKGHICSPRGGHTMRSFAGLLAVTVLLAGAAPVWGCLNDREVRTQEREFKSNYEEHPAAPYTPEDDSGETDSWIGTTLPSSLGVVLLAGALALGLTRSRRP